jgi:hypothetical protein
LLKDELDARSIQSKLRTLSEKETHLALFHGARRVAADCDGAAPSRARSPLASRPDLATLKGWLRRWATVRHRDAAERTVLTAIARGASPAALADLLFTAETDRAYADGGHSLDFMNNVLTSLAGSMRPMCCRAWSVKWWQLGVLRPSACWPISLAIPSTPARKIPG